MTHRHPAQADELAAALARQAEGNLCAEAAAMILARQRCWLTRDDFVARYVETFPALSDHTTMAVIDWHAAVAAIDTAALICSAGEEQILRTAASLATGLPVDLSGALTGIDDHNLDIVLAAIAHAGRATPRLPASPKEANDMP